METFLNEHQVKELQSQGWEVKPKQFFITLYADEFNNTVWKSICSVIGCSTDVNHVTLLSNGFKTNEELDKYPFKEGDDYYTIDRDNDVIWSCWDDVSEEFHDEDPNRIYYKSVDEAFKFLKDSGVKETTIFDYGGNIPQHPHGIIVDVQNDNRWTQSQELIECEDCCDEFCARDLLPYKYEPIIKLCENCHNNRIEE